MSLGESLLQWTTLRIPLRPIEEISPSQLYKEFSWPNGIARSIVFRCIPWDQTRPWFVKQKSCPCLDYCSSLPAHLLSSLLPPFSVANHCLQDKEQNSEQGPQGSVWSILYLPSQPRLLHSSPTYLPWSVRVSSIFSCSGKLSLPSQPHQGWISNTYYYSTVPYLLGMSQFIITHLYVNIRLTFLFPRTTGYSSTELVFSLSFVFQICISILAHSRHSRNIC